MPSVCDAGALGDGVIRVPACLSRTPHAATGLALGMSAPVCAGVAQAHGRDEQRPVPFAST